MTCIKGKWKEKLFDLLPKLQYINNLDRNGKEEASFNYSDLDQIEDSKLNINLYFYQQLFFHK